MVDERKLIDYCLNPDHDSGKHKAKVFASVGIRQADAHELRNALLAAAMLGEAQREEPTPFGERYTIDFDLFRKNRKVRIRSAWMIRHGENFPRLTTCYVL